MKIHLDVIVGVDDDWDHFEFGVNDKGLVPIKLGEDIIEQLFSAKKLRTLNPSPLDERLAMQYLTFHFTDDHGDGVETLEPGHRMKVYLKESSWHQPRLIFDKPVLRTTPRFRQISREASLQQKGA